MAEPVKLYKDDKEATIAAPSEVEKMLNDGWSKEKPQPKPEPKKRTRTRKSE